MKTQIRTLASRSLLAALVVLAAAGCTHYWERPGGAITDFDRESAACIDDARRESYGPDGMQQVYRACMRARAGNGQVSVAEDNQFRGPEDSEDFGNPPPALGGRRYQKRLANAGAPCRFRSAHL